MNMERLASGRKGIMKTVACTIGAIILLTFTVVAQSEVFKFKNLIDTTYNFYPSALTAAEKKAKMPLLDAFAEHVLSDKTKYLPLLRHELQDSSNNRYFLFDGASLLYRTNPNKADLQLCANAIAKTRIADIQGQSYFYFTMDLGKMGANTYSAIENILNYPAFEATVPEHSLVLGQNLAVFYCCLQIDDELFLDNLIKRLSGEQNTATAQTIIFVLASTVTEKARKALLQFADKTDQQELKLAVTAFKYTTKASLPTPSTPPQPIATAKLLSAFKSREYALNETIRKQIYNDLPYLVKKNDYDKIKRIRREMAYTISDESLQELAFLTHLLKLSFTSAE
jgi:hypothetical protein